jgi:hypothetical protein
MTIIRCLFCIQAQFPNFSAQESGERPVHHQPYALPPGRIALQVGQVPEEKCGKSTERKRANLSHSYVVTEQCQVPKGL